MIQQRSKTDVSEMLPQQRSRCGLSLAWRATLGVAAVSVVAFSGCNNELPKSPPGVVDPSGIDLQNELRNAPVVRLDDAPAITLGGLTDDPATEFNHSNGFLGGVPVGIGAFVVIDQDKIRVLGNDSKQLAQVGRSGRGPGEMGGLSHVCTTRGDTIVAYDYQQRRVSIVSPGGSLVKQIDVATIGQLPANGCLGDGTFLLTPFVGAENSAISIISTEGKRVGSIRYAFNENPIAIVSVFSHGDQIWLADPASRELLAFNANGRVVSTLRLRERRLKMTDAEAAMNSPSGSARAGSQPRKDVGKMKLTKEVSYWPLYQNAMSGGPDRIWLQKVVKDGFDPVVWYAITTEGNVIGQIKLHFDGDLIPPIVQQFVGDSVWLLRRNADGTATFYLYRLVFPGAHSRTDK
ncbi:MAG: hypothetical protein KF812_13135 [Fimbriimonadaceae bacterium]|nr:hypothetical protein [Fimbriimonadaceae bacterium]